MSHKKKMSGAKTGSSFGALNYKGFHKDFKSVLTNYALRNWLWYIVTPLVVMYTLTPGLLISIPPARECNTNDLTWAKPKRVTPYNALVHVLLTWFILIAIFYWGAISGFAFPFTGHVVDALLLPQVQA
jgi:hypothetical protein